MKNWDNGVSIKWCSGLSVVAFALIASVACAVSVESAPMQSRWSELRHLFAQSLDCDCEVRARISVGRSLTVVQADTTKKGNGSVTIGNLKLRLFDVHNDGEIFENDVLKVDSVDLDDNGLNDLVVSGIVVFTGEKESDSVLRKQVLAIYMQIKPDIYVERFTNSIARIKLD